MKKISVKPVETLEIEFSDGVTKHAKFTTSAFMLLDEEFPEGSIGTFQKAQKTPFDTAAKLLYVGMKASGEDVTLDTVKNLIKDMNIENILDIIEFAIEEFSQLSDEKKNEIDEPSEAAEPSEIDWDYLYYLYCVELKRPEEEFYIGPPRKIFGMLDKHLKVNIKPQDKGQVKHIKSMREMPGWC